MEMYLHAPCYIDGMIRPNLAASLLVFSALFCRLVHAQTSTATVLAVTVNGSSASQISAGSPITLTATVTSGGSPITQGQVNFCNAAVVHCTDVNVLGTAPLGPNGAATLVLRPGTGAYSYRAGFLGTPRTSTPYAASSSSSVGLTVSGSYPSASTITATGNPGNYTLVASVYGFNNAHSAAAPTGTVSFIDSATGNSTLGTASLAAANPGPYWYNYGDFPTGSETASVVSGDFNNDGNQDFAIGTVETTVVYLGNGHGGFQQVTSNAITVSGSPVLVADFNGDGKLDLLLSNAPLGPASLTVLLGNGDGTFTPAANGPIYTNYGNSPLVTADFNGDGIPDIAAAGGYYLVVLLGKGDGTFTQSLSVSQADLFGGMVAGDFNNDGKQDIAVSDNTFGQTITLYLGNGDGTFTQGTTLNVSNESGGSAVNLAAADFNGDGNLDLVTPIYGGTGPIPVYLGKGDGTFTAASAGLPVAVGYANTAQIGDFNGDGLADIYITGPTSLQNLAIYLSNGDGTFTLVPSANTPELPCCRASALADVNNDGVTDIIASDFYNSQADVYLTALTQSTASISGISVTGASPQQVFASYPGDSTYASSQSSTTPLEVVAAAPTFSPAGGTIGQTQSITISSTTPGATIYYQVSGTSNQFLRYIAPLQYLTLGSVTVQAYAVAANYGQSAIATATYTVVAPNPVPTIVSVSPAYSRKDAATLSVILAGSGYVTGSVAYWGSAALATQFTSASQLSVQVPASVLETAGINAITVQNAAPGGGTSNAFQFEVDSGAAAAAPTFTTSTATVSAGNTASYSVVLPLAATNVSVMCLNLPAGATCSYLATSGTLSIATTSATPKGSYQITAVFTETAPTTFLTVLWAPLLLLPAAFSVRRKMPLGLLLVMTVALLTLPISGCSGKANSNGGTNSGSGSNSQTTLVTSSSTITLQVQ
jgi:trimeric autotransporter adhesin